MKIIQVSSYYPPHLGGQENAVQGLARQLAAAGNEVHVLSSSKGGKKGMSTEEGVQVRRFWGPEFGHAPIMPAFAPHLLSTAGPKSVVHLHIGQAFTPEMVWLAAKVRRFPYVAQLHIDFEPSGPAGILLPLYKRLVLRRVLRSAAAVIVLNKKTLHLVQKNYGVQPARLMTNGIDEAYFAVQRAPLSLQKPHQLRLLFVGRLTRQKNAGMLLEAVARAKDAKIDVKLDIIGDGEERAALEQLIKELGLSTVTLHGRLERQAVLPFYAQCDALVMPSLYEAQPLVLLEAMAARIPIIGTNVIGVAEHIWGVGIVVPPTADGLVDGFEKLRSSHRKLPAMVEAGHRKAQKLRWRNLQKEYQALYEEVLDG